MTRMRLLAAAAAVLVLAGCEEDAAWEADVDQLEVVPITQVKRELPPRRAAGEGAETARYVVWDHWLCDVTWNQRCGTVEIIAAPPGWQVCKPLWGKVQKGRGSPTWIVTMKPDLKAEYVMTAAGSRKYHDQWGSMIRVEEIGVEIIPQGASAAQREAAGCLDPGVVTPA